MDAVTDTQDVAEEPGPGSCEIVKLDDFRRARGLPAARPIVEDTDPFPWAYTFGP